MKNVLMIVLRRILGFYLRLWSALYITMGCLHLILLDLLVGSQDIKSYLIEMWPTIFGVWFLLVSIRGLLTPEPPQKVIIVEDRSRRGKR
ncbi:hypothetical protein RW115_12085 [Macrococcus capreoli]